MPTFPSIRYVPSIVAGPSMMISFDFWSEINNSRTSSMNEPITRECWRVEMAIPILILVAWVCVYLSGIEIEREFGGSVRAFRLFTRFFLSFYYFVGAKVFCTGARKEIISDHKVTHTNDLATLWLALLSLTACGADFVTVSSQTEQAGCSVCPKDRR